MPLSEEIVNQIQQEAEDIYNELDEKARGYDALEYGLPFFEKCKEPIEKVLTLWAERYQELRDILQSALDRHEEDKRVLYNLYPELKEKFETRIHPWVEQARKALHTSTEGEKEEGK